MSAAVELSLQRKYLRISWFTSLITPNGKINPYEKKLSVSVGMAYHKLFSQVRTETRIVGLLQCSEHTGIDSCI